GMVVIIDGVTAINIHTESTLSNSTISTKCVMSLTEGDVSHGMVLDPKGNVLFAYDIWMSKVPDHRGAFTIRVMPPDPNHFMPQYVTFAPGDRLRVTVYQPAEFSGLHIV